MVIVQLLLDTSALCSDASVLLLAWRARACSGAAGSSRTVSRRYIADFVSKRDRMRASTGAAQCPLHAITATSFCS
jgi:hypothetical protein